MATDLNVPFSIVSGSAKWVAAVLIVVLGTLAMTPACLIGAFAGAIDWAVCTLRHEQSDWPWLLPWDWWRGSDA